MVKRKLKIAQILCAVYSLSNPDGATRAEIIKFCALRFGVSARVHEYVKLLQQAVDSGLLNYFCQRYRLARLGCCILWGKRKQPQTTSGRKLVARRKNKRGQNKNTSSLFKLWCLKLKRNMIRTKQNCKEGAKKFKRNGVQFSSNKKVNGCNRGPVIKNGSKHTIQTNTKATSSNNNKHVSLYKRRSYKTKNSPTTINSRRKGISCHKVGIPHSNANCKRPYTKNTCKGQLATVKRRSCRKCSKNCKLELKRKLKKANINIIKQNLRSKNRKQARKQNCKQKPQQKKTSKSKNSEKTRIQKFHREILRQTKLAVAHAKSWDNLNKELQRSQRENKELMKSSQLVQKILSGSHGSSWDDLNKKLRLIKANSKPEIGFSQPRLQIDNTR